MAAAIFNGGWNSYTLQCDMWLWNRNSEFTKWQHPAMWHVALESWHRIRQVAAPCSVALGWHAIEFAQTSVILEFYICFRFFRPHHRSRHVILHQSPKFYPNRTTLERKKWRHVDFQDGGSQPSWISEIMGSLKIPRTTSYRSSIETIALNCLVFEKIAFFLYFGDRQTDRRTDGQHRCTKLLSLSRAAA